MVVGSKGDQCALELPHGVAMLTHIVIDLNHVLVVGDATKSQDRKLLERKLT